MTHSHYSAINDKKQKVFGDNFKFLYILFVQVLAIHKKIIAKHYIKKTNFIAKGQGVL